MAEQLLYGDERDVGSQQIVGEGAPVRITRGTGIPWGMIVRGAAYTPCTSVAGALSMAGREHRAAHVVPIIFYLRHRYGTGSVLTACSLLRSH